LLQSSTGLRTCKLYIYPTLTYREKTTSLTRRHTGTSPAWSPRAIRGASRRPSHRVVWFRSPLLQEPLTLGHESSGVVTAVGSSVTNLKVGDRVALEVGLPCLECELCQTGRYNICKSLRFRSSAKSFPHFQGTLQARINHPAVYCHK